MNPEEKPLFRLNGAKLATPPLGAKARREAGFLLGKVQEGEVLAMPQARALPGIAAGLYELRVREAAKTGAFSTALMTITSSLFINSTKPRKPCRDRT